MRPCARVQPASDQAFLPTSRSQEYAGLKPSTRLAFSFENRTSLPVILQALDVRIMSIKQLAASCAHDSLVVVDEELILAANVMVQRYLPARSNG
jgi:hypothetical protein